jgi:nucleotide-binding universal stress UspA family protein
MRRPTTTRLAVGAEKWRRSLKGIKILAVLDGSGRAESVLPKAVELVRYHPGTKVVVIRAVDPATLTRDGGNTARVAAINEAAEYLGEVAARLRSEGVRPVGRSVWYAAAGPSIVELARTVKPDLILMAADRRNRAGRLVQDPIAEFVRNRTQTPIVLVSAGDSPAETSAQDMTAEGKEMIHV